MQPHDPSLSSGARRLDATPPSQITPAAAPSRPSLRRVGTGSAIAAVGLGLLVTMQPATGAALPAPSDAPARQAPAARPTRALRDDAARRNAATIRLLQERVAMLEARLNALAPVASAAASATPAPTAATAATAASAPPPSATTSGSPDTAPRAQPAASVAQAAAPSPQAPQPASTGAGPVARTAGSFDIDEDAAQRALERTLTQSGALLLQPGTIEFSPGFSYSRTEQVAPILLTLPVLPSGATITSIAENRVRRNEFTARADFRIGLPMNAQAEFGLPVSHTTAQQNNTFDPVTSKSATRLGDVTFGLAKTFAREKGVMPDVIGRLTYNTGSGQNLPSPLSTGGGFHQLQAEVIAVKRQDPLAFVASVGYARVFEKDGIKPGDATVLSLSSLLAASPATSLQLGFSQVLRAKQQVGGVRLDGSDQTYGLLTLGATSILSRDLTLVTQFGVGVGGDAPRYTFNAALPILFR